MVKKFKEYNFDNDYKIIEQIIPYVIKKHSDLLKWANKKFDGTGEDITEICFEYSEHLNSWSVITTASNWNNKINRYIQNVFAKEVKEYSKEKGLNVRDVTYASLHNTQEKHYFIFDIENKKIIKK